MNSPASVSGSFRLEVRMRGHGAELVHVKRVGLALQGHWLDGINVPLCPQPPGIRESHRVVKVCVLREVEPAVGGEYTPSESIRCLAMPFAYFSLEPCVPRARLGLSPDLLKFP